MQRFYSAGMYASLQGCGETMKITDADIRKALIELIQDGYLAAIVTPENISYINACQIKVKCPHCGKIVNEGKYNPHPKEKTIKLKGST